MAAAAGAPPPPPPPPPPHTPKSIDSLPAELLLIIYTHAGLASFLNLALAIYPTLFRHGLAPELTTETLLRILYEWRGDTHYNASFVRPLSQWPAANRIPTELWLQIADYLEPIDAFRLVFSVGSRFYIFQDPPTEEAVRRLLAWSRRYRKRR